MAPLGSSVTLYNGGSRGVRVSRRDRTRGAKRRGSEEERQNERSEEERQNERSEEERQDERGPNMQEMGIF